jgi:hypothetical protein
VPLAKLRLATFHLLAGAILLWLGYYWLGVAETRASTLAESIALAALILVLACAVYGAAFVYFTSPAPAGIGRSLRTSLTNILPLASAVLVAGILYWQLQNLSNYSAKPAFQLASWMTLKMRKPIRPSSIAAAFNTVFWVIRWMVVPVFLLPALAAISSTGWRGFRNTASKVSNWRYWILTPLTLFCAIKVPLLLLNWIPRAASFNMQAVSFAWRGALAYLLFGCGWLALAFITSGGKPRLTQPTTTVSP